MIVYLMDVDSLRTFRYWRMSGIDISLKTRKNLKPKNVMVISSQRSKQQWKTLHQYNFCKLNTEGEGQIYGVWEQNNQHLSSIQETSMNDPLENPIFSLETTIFSLETHMFLLETPIISVKTPLFQWRPRIFVRDPQIHFGDPPPIISL